MILFLKEAPLLCSCSLQSSLHKVELEDEVDLVYAVVTLPAGFPLFLYTVEPLNKGHVGTRSFVLDI